MKIRTALRTNQIAGFVTVPAWKKMKSGISCNYTNLIKWLLFDLMHNSSLLSIKIKGFYFRKWLLRFHVHSQCSITVKYFAIQFSCLELVTKRQLDREEWKYWIKKIHCQLQCWINGRQHVYYTITWLFLPTLFDYFRWSWTKIRKTTTQLPYNKLLQPSWL